MKNKEQTKDDQTIDLGFWRDVWQQARLVWRLFRDPAVPLYLKIIPFGALVYLISPIDFMPDAIVGLGQLDDLGVVLLGARLFTQMTPKTIVERHLAEIRAEDGIAPGEDSLKATIIIDGEK